MRDSPQWSEGRFANEQPMWTNMRSGLLRLFESTPGDLPDAPVPVVMDGGKGLRTAAASGLRVTWFGHSSVMVEIDGVTVLIDPLWSERASPLSWVGPKRWYPSPVALRELPRIDVVMISHDHYDHLDRSTVTVHGELGYNLRGAARRGCASGTLGHPARSYRRTGLVAVHARWLARDHRHARTSCLGTNLAAK